MRSATAAQQPSVQRMKRISMEAGSHVYMNKIDEILADKIVPRHDSSVTTLPHTHEVIKILAHGVNSRHIDVFTCTLPRRSSHNLDINADEVSA